jgi:hypothetical protein
MPTLKYNTADLHLKPILKKAGLYGCNFRIPYYIYGMKTLERPMLALCYTADHLNWKVEEAIGSFESFMFNHLKTNIHGDTYTEIYIDHCHIGVRLDLREHHEFAGALIKLFIGLCEGHITNIPEGLKLKNIPKFNN